MTALIDTELGHRPGPAGVPIRAVLVCLLDSIHYTGKAILAEAWRLAASSLSPRARERHGVGPDRPHPDDPHACLADNRRFYRAFDRLTSLLGPAGYDRRARLPRSDAGRPAAAWEDDDPDHARRRNLLQEIVTALVLTALLVTVANDHFLDTWRRQHHSDSGLFEFADNPEDPPESFVSAPPTGESRPPPIP
ncbi:hypothetical protein [Streptosporangium roseum]|uniref:hypothetical protein n=1 Tax=Streptosporangium roseum TaxID=2001 RepID=UPI003318730E